MSLQRISKAEQFALWAIFTSRPGGRLLEYSDIFPLVISKFMPCSVRIPWLPQPCGEYIFITLSSQIFFTRWFFLVLLLTAATKTPLVWFFFQEATFPAEPDPWSCVLTPKRLSEIESTKAKISLSLIFFPLYVDIQLQCLIMDLMDELLEIYRGFWPWNGKWSSSIMLLGQEVEVFKMMHFADRWEPWSPSGVKDPLKLMW